MHNSKSLAQLCAVVFSLALSLAASGGTAKVEVAMAKDKDSKPATTFSADLSKIYVFVNATGLSKGDKLRSVWTAEDVCEAAPANTKIDEASLVMEGESFSGSFSLSKPTNGWPVGKYRVDIYRGDETVATARFSFKGSTKSAIEAAADSAEEK